MNDDVAICIITSRRPRGLERLLQSLERLETPRPPHCVSAVVVVDNDPSQSARGVVEQGSKRLPWPVHYVCEPRPGIPFARNRAIQEAGDSAFIAFIDDDQTASVRWVSAMLEAALDSGADAALGPLEFEPEGELPRWYHLPEFKTFGQGELLSPELLRTGGLLLRRAALQGIPGPFDEQDAFTGGTDSKLGLRLAERGSRLVWAADASTREFLPTHRLSVHWALARSFRNGANRARMESDVRSYLRAWRKQGRSALLALPYQSLLGSLELLRGDLRGAFGHAESLSYAVGILGGLFRLRYNEYSAVHDRAGGRSEGQGPDEGAP